MHGTRRIQEFTVQVSCMAPGGFKSSWCRFHAWHPEDSRVHAAGFMHGTRRIQEFMLQVSCMAPGGFKSSWCRFQRQPKSKSSGQRVVTIRFFVDYQSSVVCRRNRSTYLAYGSELTFWNGSELTFWNGSELAFWNGSELTFWNSSKLTFWNGSR